MTNAPESRSTYRLAAAAFPIALALVYMAAFASFGIQARGLVGSEGILPVATYLPPGPPSFALFLRAPTLFWWSRGDLSLLAVAWSGVALAAVAILAKPHSGWQRAIFAILYVYHLSIVTAGQSFLQFQWDYLLLETGFLAVFLVPDRWRPLLFRLLLFRLMLESGLVKLLSHDANWRNLTALSWHYWTQPLPAPPAWLAAKLPMAVHQFCTAMVFAIELPLPFLMLGPRRWKYAAGFGTLALQILIALTGNYTYFNLLTMALCLFLFDDEFLLGLGVRLPRRESGTPNRFLTGVLAAFTVVVGGTEIYGMFRTPPAALEQLVETQSAFGIVNRYGLFAVMTTSRPEIEIEGSMDGETWLPYIFPHKAGPLGRMPGWVAPLQPRLDWQMWFASLGTPRQNPWFAELLLRLLTGSKPVLALFERAPFGDRPPKYVRAMRYEYRFTTFEERRRTGNWWTRESRGVYFPAASLRGRP